MIGALNMRVEDTTNYVNKLAQLGVVVPRYRALLSASRSGYSNDLICLDNARSPGSVPFIITAAIQLPLRGVPPAKLWYAASTQAHIVNATNVAGYVSWGGNSRPLDPPVLVYTNTWTTDGTVRFYGASRWWLIQSIESWNGVWVEREPLPQDTQGSYQRWFSAPAFGGSGYSATPIGGVEHVSEPTSSGMSLSEYYFGLWQFGRSLGVASWTSANTHFHAVTGDPLVSR